MTPCTTPAGTTPAAATPPTSAASRRLAALAAEPGIATTEPGIPAKPATTRLGVPAVAGASRGPSHVAAPSSSPPVSVRHPRRPRDGATALNNQPRHALEAHLAHHLGAERGDVVAPKSSGKAVSQLDDTRGAEVVALHERLDEAQVADVGLLLGLLRHLGEGSLDNLGRGVGLSLGVRAVDIG